MKGTGELATRGDVFLRVIKADGSTKSPWPAGEIGYQEALSFIRPQKGLSDEVNAWREENLPNVLGPLTRLYAGMKALKGLRVPAVLLHSRLWLVKIRADGVRIPLGLASVRVITDAGVNFLVDAWQNSVELEILRYHGIGTGTTAPVVGNTALETEWTTEYTGDVRATGTLAEGASANIFQSVGTNTKDTATVSAVTEHGILSQAATGGGTLWDRHTFSAVNVDQNESIESTYDMTATSGG